MLLGRISFQDRVRVLPHHIIYRLYNVCHFLSNMKNIPMFVFEAQKKHRC